MSKPSNQALKVGYALNISALEEIVTHLLYSAHHLDDPKESAIAGKAGCALSDVVNWAKIAQS